MEWNHGTVDGTVFSFPSHIIPQETYPAFLLMLTQGGFGLGCLFLRINSCLPENP
ncbi:hypothetical protein B0T17DRAFT_543259 [Bombardia bombarda]|uniref:Uncharacterized protein n=1 Tax=Bombardia bombarda TaxID=252184 RepID=A0AA39TM50_9PEZI|nr:hypothetical protein B0T17DRAFT_543259 [Bombardia bombarda]